MLISKYFQHVGLFQSFCSFFGQRKMNLPVIKAF